MAKPKKESSRSDQEQPNSLADFARLEEENQRLRSEVAELQALNAGSEVDAFSHRQAQEMVLLDRVRTALSRDLDLDTIIRTVVEGVTETLGYSLVNLYFRRGDFVFLQRSVGYEKVIEEFPISKGIIGKVVRSGQPILLKDIQSDPDYWDVEAGIVSEVCVPLFDREQVVGALNVESTRMGELGEADLHLLTVLGEHISIALERARLYAEIRQSEERYRSLFENKHTVMLLIDPQSGKIENANPAACAFYGYERQHMLTLKISDINILSKEQIQAEMERARTEQRSQFNMRHRLANGEIREVEVYSGAIQMGERQLLYSIVHDDTRRKQMEDTLAQERNLLRTLIDNIPDNIYVKDLEGRKTLVNLKDVQTCGYKSEEEVLGKTDAELFPPHIAAQFMANDNTVLKTRQALLNREEFNEDKTGKQTWQSTSKLPLFDRAGKIIGLVGIGHDITDHKRILDELYQSRTMLQLILDTIPQRVFWKDLNLTFLGCNLPFARDAGLADPDDIIGKNDFEIGGEENAPQYRADDQQVMKTNTPKLNYEDPKTLFDGRKILVRTNKTPLHDRDGKVIGILGTYEDITERKLAEEELQLANEKLTKWVSSLEQRNRESDILRQMDDLLQICNETGEAFDVIQQFCPQLFPGMSGALYILSNSRRTVEAAALWGETLQSDRIFAPDDCWALRRGQMHRVSQSNPGLRCKHVKESFSDAYLDIPMMASGEILGMLHIEGQYEEVGSPLTQDLTRTVAEHLALSLSNLNLRDTLRTQSIRDALTGLYNRRYMEESLERELHRALRKQAAVGIIMLDIDHFKNFNDTYGHDAGDAVLRELGVLLHRNVRGEDIACRYGGEEFILILPDSTLEVTQQRAEIIRQLVRSMNIEYRRQSLGIVTVSLGVAVFPDHTTKFEEIVQKADKALYQAKHNGRDRVEIAQLDQEFFPG